MGWLLSSLAWMTGSDTGRRISGRLIAAVSVVMIVYFVFRKGADAEKLKQAQASLDALRARISTDDEISRMSRDDRRAELSRWVRDGPGR